MDHAVSVDLKSNELERLLNGKTTAIIRGASGRMLPCDKVFPGEYVYFVRDLGEQVAVARGLVKDCRRFSGKDQNSVNLVRSNMKKMGFTDQEAGAWSKRKHILLVELDKVSRIGPFAVDFFNRKNWLAVEYINKIRKD
ncbi:MAG TPA: hypothetical protein P5080_00570 [Candidatus Paceibacterota bacterium]|nr:hypothetical protein [Candidatus Pacearchaeota archaeon]HRZ50469.1 hypothetical protein [Candidatus Paceibacterota bacterium]HSA36190.1 hypothetical protein [Candidatus Paceibacterota bacterium]